MFDPTTPRYPAPLAELNTPEQVQAVRARAATKSATYRTAITDPFALIATGGPREIDLPF